MAEGLVTCARLAGVPFEFVQTVAGEGSLETARYCVKKPDGTERVNGYRTSIAVPLLKSLWQERSSTFFPAQPSASTQPTLPPPSHEPWRDVATFERAVYGSDTHFPYADADAVGVFLGFIRWFTPTHVYLLGDIADFYQISKFDKDPGRLLALQSDIDEAADFIRKVRRVAPDASIHFVVGNHEDRLRKYLYRVPELSSLRGLYLPELLRLQEYGVNFIDQQNIHLYHGLCLEHGEVVRKNSGYTARAQMEKRGVNGISGHTHRLGIHYHSNLGGDYLWAENGCLCDRRPSYTKAPDWQTGFTVTHYRPDTERFALEQVLVYDAQAVFAGREFSPLRDI